MTETLLPDRRDWKTAWRALRTLLSDGDDTTQVFVIMRALNAGNGKRNYARLVRSFEGGRIAYAQQELADKLSDPAYIDSFAPGTVGAAYRDFLHSTGFSAMGLAEVSNLDKEAQPMRHPYAWFGRRIRDTHDIWHVLTGYKAEETLGEACLVAFSYAQVGGLGWAFIAVGASIKSVLVTRRFAFARAVWEGYRRGRRAAWLAGEDYHALLNEPIAAARARLGLGTPAAYARAARLLGPQAANYASLGTA
ncbi:Coq4 family protein [Sphingomonas sp.]|uniref:Coq4 family protein n=1 Tax=Sphingomonas sp. TaxID=28214 RepID=UPI001DC50F74|nr:Coq4 family protein [Sphingomonas sp.]MBX9796461.1 ubiquinone biosynthesis protein [Sphingomonas sp.]